MNLSINLDEYLSSYDSFTFCKDLLKEYFTGYRYNPTTKRDEKTFDGKSPFADSYGVIDDIDGEAFYYRTNGSQDYYKRLLQENYNTLYQLISIHLTRTGEELSWHDWYIVASNAYKMKGNIASLKYILQHFGDDPLTGVRGKYTNDQGYDTDLEDGDEANIVYTISRSNSALDVHEITLTIKVSTKDVDLSKYLLEILARELLIVEESGAVFDEQDFICVVVFKQDINYTFDYQLYRQIDIQECRVLGNRIDMIDVNLPYDRAAFVSKIDEYSANSEPWDTTYTYNKAVIGTREEVDGKEIPYAYLNTGVPLFTWYALGRIYLPHMSKQTSFNIQYNTEITPILIDSPFYYKIEEQVGFKFGFSAIISSSRSSNTPILNNDTDLNISLPNPQEDSFVFTSSKIINRQLNNQP